MIRNRERNSEREGAGETKLGESKKNPERSKEWRARSCQELMYRKFCERNFSLMQNLQGRLTEEGRWDRHFQERGASKTKPICTSVALYLGFLFCFALLFFWGEPLFKSYGSQKERGWCLTLIQQKQPWQNGQILLAQSSLRCTGHDNFSSYT